VVLVSDIEMAEAVDETAQLLAVTTVAFIVALGSTLAQRTVPALSAAANIALKCATAPLAAVGPASVNTGKVVAVPVRV
jgi:hypothetical protein